MKALILVLFIVSYPFTTSTFSDPLFPITQKKKRDFGRPCSHALCAAAVPKFHHNHHLQHSKVVCLPRNLFKRGGGSSGVFFLGLLLFLSLFYPLSLVLLLCPCHLFINIFNALWFMTAKPPCPC